MDLTILFRGIISRLQRLGRGLAPLIANGLTIAYKEHRIVFIQLTRMGTFSGQSGAILHRPNTARVLMTVVSTLSILALSLLYHNLQGVFSAADASGSFVANFMPPEDQRNQSIPALIQVNQPPQIAFFSPANGSSFVEGNAIILLAAASDSDGTVIKVEFFADSVKIGEDTNGGNGWGFSWIGATVGDHTLTMVAADNGGAVSVSAPIQISVLTPTPTFTPTNTATPTNTPTQTNTPTNTATPTPTFTPTLPPDAQEMAIRIVASADDAEETEASGNINLTSNDLDIVDDGSARKIIGLRFRQLPIPPQATVLRAALEFTASGVDGGATSWLIQGQAIGDAPTFTTAKTNVSARGRTTAAVSWPNVAPWDSQNQIYVSPSLTTVVQEIINRGDWVAGSDIALIITGSGQRRAVSYDRSASKAPRLLLAFSLPPTPTSTLTPTATDTIEPTPTPTETATFTPTFTVAPSATFTPTFTLTPTPIVAETATPLMTGTPLANTPTALPQETAVGNTPTTQATAPPMPTTEATASITPAVDATATPESQGTPVGATGPVFDAVQTYEFLAGKNDGETLPAPGDFLLIRTIIKNSGGQNAQNASFYQTFGNYLDFVEGSIVVEREVNTHAAANLGNVSQFPLFFGEIAANSTVTLTFQVQIQPDTPSDVASLSLQGRVEADNALPVLTRSSSQDAASRPTVILLEPLSALSEKLYLPLLRK